MLLSYYFIKEDWNVHGRITVVMNETCSTFPDNFLFAPLNKLEPLNPWCHWGVCVPCCFFLGHYIIDAKYPLAMANFCQKIWLTTFNGAFFPNHIFFLGIRFQFHSDQHTVIVYCVILLRPFMSEVQN